MPTALPAPITAEYSDLTQASALTQLARTLNDDNLIYWSAAELRLYLAEALRTWQCYTGWYRVRMEVETAPNQHWYEVPIASTITEKDIASIALYHLLESQIALGIWTGTEQFTASQLKNALEARLDRFFAETGLVTRIEYQESGTEAIVSGRVNLAMPVADLRRLAWINSLGSMRTLWRANEWEMNSFAQGWHTPQQRVPLVYSQAVQMPNRVQLAPVPAEAGQLEIAYIPQGRAVDFAAPLSLGIPDDYSWGLKWSVLAAVFASNGQSRDPERAGYCEQRYSECVELCKTAPGALQTSLDGKPIFTNSASDLDTFQPGWQNQAPAVPQSLGMLSRNLFALSPAPNGTSIVRLDLAANIPVPTTDSDYLQVPGDVLPSLLGYAQHLACFKMGGNDFLSTRQLHANLLTTAAQYNGRLKQMNFYQDAMRSIAQVNQAQVPRIETPILTATKPAARQES